MVVSAWSVSRVLGRVYQCLGLLDVLLAEQKLPVQVAQINRVKVNDVDLAKAGEHNVLEQFASDSAGADQEYAGLFRLG